LEDTREEQHDDIAVTRVFRKSDERDQDGFERPRVLQAIRQKLTQLKPDIVHVHSFAGLSLGISKICNDLSIPVVVTFHDMWMTCARYFRLPAPGVVCPTGSDHSACVPCVHDTVEMDVAVLTQALEHRDALMRAEIACASACTSPSQTAASLVRDCLPFAGDIEVIPHGLLREVSIDEAAVSRTARKRLRIGTFGGLVESKGIRELVQACVELIAAGYDCELHLSGPWHQEDLAAEIRDLAHLGGLDLIERGRFASADRHPACDLDLAVFPSKCQETYGLVVDEALAHRVPVVVSNFGALAERSATPGVVVASLDALAEVLKELISSPEMLASLRNTIPEQMPTIKVSAKRHLAIYQTLIGAPR
jgi:glycosyltransferase involved in cell wall biosynthesis